MLAEKADEYRQEGWIAVVDLMAQQAYAHVAIGELCIADDVDGFLGTRIE